MKDQHGERAADKQDRKSHDWRHQGLPHDAMNAAVNESARQQTVTFGGRSREGHAQEPER